MIVVAHRFLVPKGFIGITLFPFVFLRSKELTKDEVLLHHERIHLRQQAELLIVFFFIWYAVEFLYRWWQTKNRKKAYHAISFEREAYANEHQTYYLKIRKRFAFWAYL